MTNPQDEDIRAPRETTPRDPGLSAEDVRAINLDPMRPLPPGCWVLLVIVVVVAGWWFLS